MGFLHFKPEQVDNGQIEMSHGIHRHVVLTKIDYELGSNSGDEFIRYEFIKKAQKERYTFRQKMTNSKLDFAANIIHHITSQAINIQHRSKEVEKRLRIGPIEESPIPIYSVDVGGEVIKGNIIIAILNMAEDVKELTELLELLRSTTPEKECAIKLSINYYNGKTTIGFKQINLPFVDSDPEGSRLRWSDEKDIEKPTLLGSPIPVGLPSIETTEKEAEDLPF